MSHISARTATRTMTILFLSRRGSARAVMAAAIAGRVGQGRLRGIPAAVQPVTERDPATLDLLRRFDYPTEDVPAPRHFGEVLADPLAPAIDFVFTLSDTAAGEAPPEWPGHPVTAHWGCHDPVLAAAAVKTAERGLAYLDAYAVLERRIRIFAALPFDQLNRMRLTAEAAAIGRGD